VINGYRIPFPENIARAPNFQSFFSLNVWQIQFKGLQPSFSCQLKDPVETLQTPLVDGAHFVTLHAMWQACQA
jgi:hypothetical protein